MAKTTRARKAPARSAKPRGKALRRTARKVETAPVPSVKWSRPWAKAFLRGMVLTGNVSRSCFLAGVPRSEAYVFRDSTPEFAKAWDDAKEQYTDRLVAEVDRRAFEGFEKPVFQGGARVGEVREYSDALAIIRLKALRPNEYRERAELTGPSGAALQFVALGAISPAMQRDAAPDAAASPTPAMRPVTEGRA